MDTVVVKGGKFTFTISSLELSKGLRPSKRMPRNNEHLVECVGAVGQDGTLETLDELTRIATTTITDGFPFPQLFVLTNMVIVCGLKKIYEWVRNALVLKYTASAPGSIWSCVDFYDYVYMSNGIDAVIRDAGSKVYSLSSTLPTALSMCNYNGQVMIGSPDVSGLAADLTLDVSPVTINTTAVGSISV